MRQYIRRQVTRVTDMHGTFQDLKYPRLAEAVGEMYDFLFTVNNQWFYSHSDRDHKMMADRFGVLVNELHERWRIVDPVTGVVVAKG